MSRTPLGILFRSTLLVALASLLLCTGCFWGGSSPFSQDREQEGPTTRGEPDSDSFDFAGAGGEALSEAELNPRLPGKEMAEDPGSLFYLAAPGDDSFALAGFETEGAVRSSGEGALTPPVPPIVAPPTRRPPPSWTPEAPGPEPPGFEVPGPESPPDRLAEARERKEKAFERYTRLVTTGGEGDVQEALREYREAAARLKELEGR
jgi:hypothetical protein